MKKTKNQVIVVPSTSKTNKKTKQTTSLVKPKVQKNTTDYYRCLCETSKQGLGNITKATKFCRANAPAITQARKEEATKILVSLAKLLQH